MMQSRLRRFAPAGFGPPAGTRLNPQIGQSVQTSREPPVGIAEQTHRGGHEHCADNGGVEEHRHHDDRRAGDDLRGRSTSTFFSTSVRLTAIDTGMTVA